MGCIVAINQDAIDQFSAPPEQFDTSLMNEGECFDAETEAQLDVWAAANDAKDELTAESCRAELQQKGIDPSDFRKDPRAPEELRELREKRQRGDAGVTARPEVNMDEIRSHLKQSVGHAAKGPS